MSLLSPERPLPLSRALPRADAPRAPAPRASAPRAPGPAPLEAPLGTFALIRALRDNPVATWTRTHFEQAVVSGSGVLGRVTVLSEPALIRHVLVDNAANYSKDDLTKRLLAPGLGKGLLLAEDAMWRGQRRALAPLFSPRTVQGFEHAMAEVSAETVERWGHQRDGRSVDVSAEMARVTLRVLARTVFSDGLTRTPTEFAEAVTRYLGAVGQLDPLDILDAPAFIPRIARLRARPALRFFDAAVDTMLTRRRDALAADRESVPRDLLTLLLEARDPETGLGLDEAEIKANIVTFIAAGHETTSNALTWTFYLLSQDPSWRERVEREVDAVMPDGLVEPGMVDRMVNLRAVLDEALRLYPPAATMSRQAREAERIGDLWIRAGTQVVIAPWVLHRHRRLWVEPDLFRPERFLPENKKTIDRFAYLPFGAGPRVCIGASFAVTEAMTVLATVLRRFRLDADPSHPIEPIQRISLRPRGGMPMRLYRRGEAVASRQ